MRPFILVLLIACASLGEDKTPGQPRADILAKDYKQLQSLTTKPVLVDEHLAMLCRGANQHDIEEAQKRNGPHAYTAVSIYMNDLAANAFKNSAATYPAGSVIVKEKKGQAYERTKTPDGVGGMIKRDNGYDPEHGDWEFFYFTTPDTIESGKMESCIQCHATANQDHVFGNWSRQP